MPEPVKLSEFHCVFPGGVRWRLTAAGIEVEGNGLVPVSAAARTRTLSYLVKFGDAYIAASKEFGVPAELLVACSLTESSPTNPETCLRREPGYVTDTQTPHRISVGLCQLLLSTARSAMRDPGIGRAWLFEPRQNLRACAAYMKQQYPKTSFDPILTACAYNAGGVYENKNEANRWRLRQYPLGSPRHADRFAGFFNAAMEKDASEGLQGALRFVDVL